MAAQSANRLGGWLVLPPSRTECGLEPASPTEGRTGSGLARRGLSGGWYPLHDRPPLDQMEEL